MKLKDNIVIVIDTSNYKAGFSEDVPFKAEVIDEYDVNILVRSLETGIEYELYFHQILESLDIEEIKHLLNMSNYGKPISS